MSFDAREARDGRFFGDFLRGSPGDMATRRLGMFLWGVPLAAIVATAILDVAPLTRTLVWTVSLVWVGAACLANAWRSGRVHCHATGPFFLLLAAFSRAPRGPDLMPAGTEGR